MYVRKVFKQNGSVAIVVPKELCKALGIVPGTYLMWSLGKGGAMKLELLEWKGGKEGDRGKKRDEV